MSSSPESYIGIDVAKSWLDVAWLDGATLRLDYIDDAVAGLVERLRSQPPTLVVMEATGRMETEYLPPRPRCVWRLHA